MKKRKDISASVVEKTASQWKSVEAEKAKRIKRSAKALASEERIKKDAIFTARLRKDDLEKFKKIAEKKRIPYQTLLGHVIHSYASGQLVDVNEIEKVLKKKLKAG